MSQLKFKKVLMIDNFDSFTYNLVDYFRILGCKVTVYRNTISPSHLEELDFDLLVLSPGPSFPSKAGNLMQIIERFHATKPIFGVCLGHQALTEFFGGTLKYVEPMHGKADEIICDQKSIYTGLNTNIQIARYHSLAADELPNVLDVSARSQDGTIMSFRHKYLPIEGVQFHPESVLSMKDGVGMKICENVVQGRMAAGNVGYFELMKQLQQDEELSDAHIEQFIQNMAEGQMTEDQKLILLVSFSYRLNKPDFLKAFINVLQKHAKINDPSIGETAIDICGTGGSGLPRINTSTLASLVLSKLGMPIIKHGNKAASGRFGSFDLLEALNVAIEFNLEDAKQSLKEQNLAFLFAPNIHPVVKHFGSSRAKIGVPTIFNVLGPLLNPFHPKKQFIGTSFKEYMDLIADTAILMNKEHVVVVRGGEGLDEVSVSAPTDVVEYKDGKKTSYQITPEDFGIKTIPFDKVKSDNPKQSITIAKAIVDGSIDSDHIKLVAANAAFIYSKFVKEMPLKEAYQLMVDEIRSGSLNGQLAHFISNKVEA